MKRILPIILAALLLLTVLCACGKQRPGTQEPTPSLPGAVEKPGPGVAIRPPAELPAASGTDLAIPEPWSDAAQTALDALRGDMAAQDCVCALACLGAVPDGQPLAAWLESSGRLSELAQADARYAFLPELTPAHCADAGFSGLYCLVPRAEDAAVRISAPGMDDYQGLPGAPLLFTAESGRVQVTVSPQLEFTLTTGEDGALAAQPGVLDISVPGTELTGN